MIDFEKPDYIDGILSTYFDECNIASADAASLARSKFENTEGQDRQLQIITHPEDVVQGVIESHKLRDILIGHPLAAGRKAELTVVKLDKDSDSPPYLAAIINEATLVPIACFEKRTNGQCSYLQIGQEIHEDNLIVTPDAPRNEYVEAIRELLKADVEFRNLNETIEGKEVLNKVRRLVGDEVEKYKEQVEQAMHPIACHRAQEYFNLAKYRLADLQKIKVLDDDLDMAVEFRCSRLTFPTEEYFEDDLEQSVLSGRRVQLLLAQKVQTREERLITKKRFRKAEEEVITVEENVGNLQLLAVTRGAVAVRIAEFPDIGIVITGGNEYVANEEVLKCLITAFSDRAEKYREIIQDIMIFFRRTLIEDRAGDKYVVVDDGGSTGNLRAVNDQVSAHYFDKPNPEKVIFKVKKFAGWPSFRNKIAEMLFANSAKLNKKALESRQDELMQNVCSLLGVSDKFEQYLGDSSTPAEAIVRHLGRMVTEGTQLYVGVLPGKKAGKTKTDVHTEVEVMRDGSELKVRASLRPLALDGSEAVMPFERTLYFDRVNEVKNIDNMTALAHIVGAICVSRYLRAEQPTSS